MLPLLLHYVWQPSFQTGTEPHLISDMTLAERRVIAGCSVKQIPLCGRSLKVDLCLVKIRKGKFGEHPECWQLCNSPQWIHLKLFIYIYIFSISQRIRTMLFMDNAALSSLHLCLSCPWKKKQQRRIAYHSKNIKNKYKLHFFFICAFYDNFIISAGIREGLCVFNNDLEFTGNVGILVRRAYEKP